MPDTLFKARTRAMYHNHLRRKRKGSGDLGYTMEQLRAVVKEALDEHHLCPYCHGPLTTKTFSIDHADPVSRGGTHTLDNLVVCCADCNNAKGDMTDREFTDLMAVMFDWPAAVRKGTLARLRAGNKMFRS